MGCASSKQKRCRHCHNTYSPMPRSYSMHVHHPPQSKNDTYHVVALTSSTLGSLMLDSITHHQNDDDRHIDDNKVIVNGRVDHKMADDDDDNVNNSDRKKEFSVGLIEAKTWSNMINEKIPKIVPKTPIRTPPGEPETINAWELMEGLEDTSPFRSPVHARSFSFDVVPNPNPNPNPIPTTPFDRPKSRLQENNSTPMWLQMAHNDDLNHNNSVVQDFDPEVISTFRKSLEELSPPKANDVVFENHKFPSFGKDKEKLIVYFTSLRGVRKTYEDCCHVRVILKGLGVRVDERDVSMHSGFKEELKELLKDGFYGGGLPRVFIGKRYIGGADEIRRMHEDGQLEKLLECCEKMEDDGGGGCGGGGACEACGDIRFVPCETCSGSCKIYYEENEEDEGEEDEYGFQRCPDCNENGLIRCPICCY